MQYIEWISLQRLLSAKRAPAYNYSSTCINDTDFQMQFNCLRCNSMNLWQKIKLTAMNVTESILVLLALPHFPNLNPPAARLILQQRYLQRRTAYLHPAYLLFPSYASWERYWPLTSALPNQLMLHHPDTNGQDILPIHQNTHQLPVPMMLFLRVRFVWNALPQKLSHSDLLSSCNNIQRTTSQFTYSWMAGDNGGNHTMVAVANVRYKQRWAPCHKTMR